VTTENLSAANELPEAAIEAASQAICAWPGNCDGDWHENDCEATARVALSAALSHIREQIARDERAVRIEGGVEQLTLAAQAFRELDEIGDPAPAHWLDVAHAIEEMIDTAPTVARGGAA